MPFFGPSTRGGAGSPKGGQPTMDPAHPELGRRTASLWKRAQYRKTGVNQPRGGFNITNCGPGRTNVDLWRLGGMLTPSECLLQAENYAVAASMADDETRMAMLEQA